MPRRRLPKDEWDNVRRIVLRRDNYQCTRCHTLLTEQTAHIDHIQSGKRSGNRIRELRTLCRRCHVLRCDFRHRGMIGNALRDGIIGPNWREEVWDE